MMTQERFQLRAVRDVWYVCDDKRKLFSRCDNHSVAMQAVEMLNGDPSAATRIPWVEHV